MKITKVVQSRHRIDLDPPFNPAWDTRPRRQFTVDLVRVETDEGLTGYGSGDSMAGFAGHEELFVGCDPRDLERHFRVIENLSFHYGRCWPLDVALWDLFGKITEAPGPVPRPISNIPMTRRNGRPSAVISRCCGRSQSTERASSTSARHRVSAWSWTKSGWSAAESTDALSRPGDRAPTG